MEHIYEFNKPNLKPNPVYQICTESNDENNKLPLCELSLYCLGILLRIVFQLPMELIREE